MSNPILTRALQLEMLDVAVDEGGPLYQASLLLLKEQFTPGPTLTVAEVEAKEADFDGYAMEEDLVYGSSYQAPDGTIRVAPPSVQFEATGDTEPNMIHGWAVVNKAGTKVMYSKLYDAPISIEHADDGLLVIPELVI